MRREAVLIDTNVALVANGDAIHASLLCQEACLSALEDVHKRKRYLLDSAGAIMEEYLSQKPHGFPQGVGDMFLVWLYDNQYSPLHCTVIPVTTIPNDNRRFEEFPDDLNLEKFDPSDKKFVATAIASRESPHILNATDSDWRDFETALSKHGVRIKHLCNYSGYAMRPNPLARFGFRSGQTRV